MLETDPLVSHRNERYDVSARCAQDVPVYLVLFLLVKLAEIIKRLQRQDPE